MSDVVAKPGAPSLFANWRQYIPYLGFVLIFAFFSATLYNQGFLEPNNLLNILRQTAMISIMAVGMTYVLAAGEIDLSIGMVAGLISLVAAVAMDHYGAAAGMIAGLVVGALVGLINALLTGRHPLLPHDACDDGHRTRHGDVDDTDQVRADPRRQLHLAVRRREPWANPRPGDLDPDHRDRRAYRASPHDFRAPRAGDRRQRDRGPL